MRRRTKAASAFGLILAGSVVCLAYLAYSHPSLDRYSSLFVSGAAERGAGEVLTARFLGNTNVVLSDGETSILTDGFLSNPGMRQVFFGKIAPRPERVAAALQRAGITRLAAVLVTHSHHDHILDAPEVARLTSALFVGSESSANVARGWGLPERQIRIVVPGERLRVGKFTVTMNKSRHFEFPSAWMARRAKADPFIAEPLVPPAPASAYREGGTYSVFVEHPLGNVLIEGSAGFKPGAVAGLNKRADVVFLGIGGLGGQTLEYQERYFRETVGAAGATRVFPIHWDDQTRPLDAALRPPSHLINLLARFQGGMDFIKRKVDQDPDLELALLPLWDEVVLYRQEPEEAPARQYDDPDAKRYR